jgi:methylmalonyl-CoA mutase N-terminal domain/subunit
LTDEIERQADAYIQKIDELGGALAAIDQGYIQREIQDAAYQFQQSVEKGEEIVVGVNAFQVDELLELERLKVDPAIEAAQCARLATFRTVRDARLVSEKMSILENAAYSTENLMPLLIDCIENGLTLGEICGVLRRTWGEYQPPVTL